VNTRRRLLAAVVGVLVGIGIVVAVVVWRDRGDGVDGTAVLEQPGIYDEPVTTIDQSGKPLPDVELTDADGQPVALRSLVGKPTVINIWYSTCAPCAKELQDFATVSRELGDSVQFVGVDPVDNPDKMTAFANERGVAYPLLLDSDGKLVTGADVAVFPTTLFVSSDGRIVHQTSAIGADDLRKAIHDHLGV
jgi:peroxiredoxin